MTGSSTGIHPPLYKQVIQAIRARNLLSPEQRILVAVSGGPDSVALLSLLHSLAPVWNLSLTVVHVNYGLRGAESDGDASFVAALCRRFTLPCLIRSLEIPPAEAGRSLQACARDLRYQLFRELVDELGMDRVALGHTADDQAETVLLRMLRGAGLRGLTGMPHIREGLFVRPLLGVTRREILAYLETMELSYRTDSSNAKPIYLRNRVRHELLPVMQSLAPSTIKLLARQANILREDDRLLDRLAAQRLVRSIQSRDVNGIVLDRATLLAQPVALQRRMLRQAMQALSPSARGLRGDMVFSILSSLASRRSGGSWNAGSLVVTCEQGEVRITMASSRRVAPEDAQDVAISSPARAADVVTVLALPGTLSWPVSGGRIRIRAVTRERGLALLEKPSPTLALFDAEQLTFPLTIRSWRPGDWFFPVGMTGRRKKLQDYFTDAKLGRSVREHIPLLLSQERIAWIVGQRIDARFAATASTTRFILARVTHALRRKGVF